MAAKSGITFSSLMKDLKQGSYKPVYFLHGDEPYYLDQIVHFFENKVLSEAEKAFNLSILYGRDVSHIQVVDQATRFPMMSEYQVVIIKEAQDMRDLQQLASYVSKPASSTLLVICYKHKRLDKRTKFAKAVGQNGILFESKKIYSNQVAPWIISYLKSKKYTIDQRSANLIAEYLGADLARIANELDKLTLNVQPGEITPASIEKYIGISKDHNIFELHAALATRDAKKAYRIIRYFINNPKNHPMVVIVGGIFNYFSKVYVVHGLGNAGDRDIMTALRLSSSFFVGEYRRAARAYNRTQCERVIRILREYDLRSKGVMNNHFSHEALLQEMIYRVLAA
ncbi:MAG: DNA polymerase III subunit delta [Saprospiraceae bacterium]|nr:DNA polymerase III subunit delta [Saprospiraceae bacterium]